MPVNEQQVNLVVVLGPTASGKTRLGVGVALEWGGEVVSADSRQVYRGLDLGSGKDLDAYNVDGVAVPYHLIDIADLDHEFSVFDYQKRFYETFESLEARAVLPVVVGGTGLYLDAVLRKYRMVEVPENPELRAELEAESDEALARRLLSLKGRLHNTTDLASRDRIVRAIEIAEYSASHDPQPSPDIRPLILGTQWDRSILRQRIRARLAERIDRGLIEEVEGLHARGVTWERLEQLGLEYRFIAEYIEGKIRNKNDLIQKLATAIGHFAKRQDTWFRRMERNGFKIHWLPRADFAKAAAVVERPLLEAGYKRAGSRHGR
ncbi:MAG TPA: tRNA (adenosine(37)-N6)-dimethylallyltransferase MiaA [Candidatus Bathyarchaeia archaeon]|nr:tRNA (adenosine(37)-N6)-dimethylallyltransferase MiaA [Candidatus Bathyarchaeia archaeon]